MIILLTNHHLDNFAGSELFTLGLAEELLRRKYSVYVYSPIFGSVAKKMEQIGIVVTDNLTSLSEISFDIIHAQHNVTAILARSIFPDVPMVFMSHGLLPELEQVPSIDLGILQYIAVSEEIMEHMQLDFAINKDRINIVRNFVDFNKFKITKPVNKKLLNVLIISNHFSDDLKHLVQSVTEELRLNLVHIGLPDNPVDNVEDYINDSDLVITLGRGALESMACGRNVIIYDMHGGDGMVTEENFYDLRRNNFSGRRKAIQYNYEDLKSELLKYDFNRGYVLRDLILKENSIEKNVDQIEKIYNSILTDSTSSDLKYKQLFNELYFLENTVANYYFSLKSTYNEIDYIKKKRNREIQTIKEQEGVIKQLRSSIGLMKSSKFWKMRSIYLDLRGNIFCRILKRLNRIMRKAFLLLKNTFVVLKRDGISEVFRRTSSFFIMAKKENNIEDPIVKSVDLARSIFFEQQKEFKEKEVLVMMKNFKKKPLISIVVPVYNTPIIWLKKTIESVQNQVYPEWELCIVDDCSPKSEVRDLLSQFAISDKRIRIKFAEKNGGISSASNIALQMAKGEYVALLDHDDELTKDALFWMVNEINDHPDSDIIYSDECKICDTEKQNVFDFIFKPDWSPEMMFNVMYIGHLTVYKKTLIDSVGGFRSHFDFSQDYDLALRATEKTCNIRHIERILYLWRAIDGSAAKGGKDFARVSNLNALADAAERRKIDAVIIREKNANYLKPIMNISHKISIIIPTDSYENLCRCLDAINSKTFYGNYEIVVVCNSGLANQIRDEYLYIRNIVFSQYDKKFNFSDKCNQGANDSSGDILVFYNDDVEPIDETWLENLVEYLCIPGVGAVSPKLLLENGKIQYAGMITGTPGLVGTAYNGYGGSEIDAFLTMHRYVRNVSVLSGACFAIKKETFRLVGGFDIENTPNGHSDVDFSFRILDAGLRCVYTPHATLIHIGNHTWHPKAGEKDKSDIFLLKKWGKFLCNDPFFTDAMKKVLYRDFVYDFKIFAAKEASFGKLNGDILLVSHELSLTGAPRMLLSLAELVKEAGFYPVVISPQDGPMRSEFEKKGITVVVDAMLLQNHWLTEKFIRNFDLIICNTYVSYPVINQMKDCDIPIIWWLHEASILQEVDLKKRVYFNEALLRSDKVVVVSDYASKFIDKKFSHKVNVVPNGIEDIVCKNDYSKNALLSDVSFCVIGTIEPRKGQDVFVDAIMQIPGHLRKKAKFYIVGKKWAHFESYWKKMIEKVEHVSEIELCDVMEHEQLINFIKKCDVLVCPSFDEPASMVTIEAMACSKSVIVSDHVGVGASLTNNISGFVFKAGNAEELSGHMVRLLNEREVIKRTGLAARKVYENNFTMECFMKNFMNVIREIIKDDKK